MAGDGSSAPAADAVDVERELSARDGGVLATYTLTAASGEPVTVDVVDDLPSQPDGVREIGVHPEFEPATSDVDGERIVFRETVDPGGEVVVKYGISTVDPVDEATIAAWEGETRPEVAVLEEGADAPLTRGGTSEATSDPADAFADAADPRPETGGEGPSDPDGSDDGSPGGSEDGDGPSDGLGDDADDSPIEADLDLAAGDDGIIDDLADDEPRDFVAEVSNGAGEFAADAMTGVDAGMDFGAGSDDGLSSVGVGEGLSAVAEEFDGDPSGSIRVDRFRSRLAALAGASIALHAVEDGAAAAALLDGMAEEVEAVEAEFEALRREF